MTTLAKYAFSTIALNAKIHQLLDARLDQVQQEYEQDLQNFDEQITSAVTKIPTRSPQTKEFQQLKREFTLLEQLYGNVKQKQEIPQTLSQRFDQIFSEIHQKIKEKELRFTDPSP